MSIVDSAEIDARKLIDKAKKTIQEENRFFPDEIFVKELDQIFKENERIIPLGTSLYRARLYDKESKQLNTNDEKESDSGFTGYSKEESFVNMNDRWNGAGRMNAQGIKVLYTATDQRTAAVELHPGAGDEISMAEILVESDLKIVDLSQGIARGDNEHHLYVSSFVQEYISQGHTERDYVFSQYISSYCKNKGYDGIAYKSKYARKEDSRNGYGINISIFNYEKCEPISSHVVTVKRITIEIPLIESI